MQKLKRQGVELTRVYTVLDTLSDIKYEHDQHRDNMSMIDNLAIAKKGMCFLFLGIEQANERFGPILAIDGYAKDMINDTASFDRCMERMYKRYWRHGQLNPIAEFFTLLLGSLFLYHFEAKILGTHGTVKKMMSTVQTIAGGVAGGKNPSVSETKQSPPLNPFTFMFGAKPKTTQPFSRKNHNFAPTSATNPSTTLENLFPVTEIQEAYATRPHASTYVQNDKSTTLPQEPVTQNTHTRRLMPDRQMIPPQSLTGLV
jgi:hypothetical protein